METDKLSGLYPENKNLYIKHILLKIDPASWPPKQTGQAPGQEKLSRIFIFPSPSYKVDIGPESLL